MILSLITLQFEMRKLSTPTIFKYQGSVVTYCDFFSTDPLCAVSCADDSALVLNSTNIYSCETACPSAAPFALAIKHTNLYYCVSDCPFVQSFRVSQTALTQLTCLDSCNGVSPGFTPEVVGASLAHHCVTHCTFTDFTQTYLQTPLCRTTGCLSFYYIVNKSFYIKNCTQTCSLVTDHDPNQCVESCTGPNPGFLQTSPPTCVTHCKYFTDSESVLKPFELQQCVDNCPAARPLFNRIGRAILCVAQCEFVVFELGGYFCQDYCNYGVKTVSSLIFKTVSYSFLVLRCYNTCPDNTFLDRGELQNGVPTCVDICPPARPILMKIARTNQFTCEKADACNFITKIKLLGTSYYKCSESCPERAAGYIKMQMIDTGWENDGFLCVSRCPNNLQDPTEQRINVPQCAQFCPQDLPFKLRINSSDTFLCVSSPSDRCHFIDQNNHCVQKCTGEAPGYTVFGSQKLCVPSCQRTFNQYYDLPWYHSTLQCVNSCQKYEHLAQTNMYRCSNPNSVCPFFQYFNSLKTCVSNCAGDKAGYITQNLEDQCYPICPKQQSSSDPSLFKFGARKCVDSCQGTYSFYQNVSNSNFYYCVASCPHFVILLDGYYYCRDSCPFEFGGYTIEAFGSLCNPLCPNNLQNFATSYLGVPECIVACPGSRPLYKQNQNSNIYTCESDCTFIDTNNFCLQTCNGTIAGWMIINGIHVCYPSCPSNNPVLDTTQMYINVAQCVSTCPVSHQFVNFGVCTEQCYNLTYISVNIATVRTPQYPTVGNDFKRCWNCTLYLKDGNGYHLCIQSCSGVVFRGECYLGVDMCNHFADAQFNNEIELYSDPLLQLSQISTTIVECIIQCKDFVIVSGIVKTCTPICSLFEYEFDYKKCVNYCSVGLWASLQDQHVYFGVPQCIGICSPQFKEKQGLPQLYCVKQCVKLAYTTQLNEKICVTQVDLDSSACNYYVTIDTQHECFSQCPVSKPFRISDGINYECLDNCPTSHPFSDLLECKVECSGLHHYQIDQTLVVGYDIPVCINSCPGNFTISKKYIIGGAFPYVSVTSNHYQCVGQCIDTYNYIEMNYVPIVALVGFTRTYQCLETCNSKYIIGNVKQNNATDIEYITMCVNQCPDSNFYKVINGQKYCVSTCDQPIFIPLYSPPVFENSMLPLTSSNINTTQYFMPTIGKQCLACLNPTIYFNLVSQLCVASCPLTTVLDEGLCRSSCSKFQYVNALTEGFSCVSSCAPAYFVVDPIYGWKKCLETCSSPLFTRVLDTKEVECVSSCLITEFVHTYQFKGLSGVQNQMHRCVLSCPQPAVSLNAGMNRYECIDFSDIINCPRYFKSVINDQQVNRCLQSCTVLNIYRRSPDLQDRMCRSSCGDYFPFANEPVNSEYYCDKSCNYLNSISQKCSVSCIIDSFGFYFVNITNNQNTCSNALTGFNAGSKCGTWYRLLQSFECIQICDLYTDESSKSCSNSCPNSIFKYQGAVKTCLSSCIQSRNQTADAFGQFLCSTSCTDISSTLFTFISGGSQICVENCASSDLGIQTYDNQTKNCISLSSQCNFYILEQFRALCVQNCPHLNYAKQCVDYCPLNKFVNFDNQCVDLCPSGAYRGNQCEYVANCPVYFIVNGIRKCTIEEYCPSFVLQTNGERLCSVTCGSRFVWNGECTDTPTGPVARYCSGYVIRSTADCVDQCPQQQPFVHIIQNSRYCESTCTFVLENGQCVDICQSYQKRTINGLTTNICMPCLSQLYSTEQIAGARLCLATCSTQAPFRAGDVCISQTDFANEKMIVTQNCKYFIWITVGSIKYRQCKLQCNLLDEESQLGARLCVDQCPSQRLIKKLYGIEQSAYQFECVAMCDFIDGENYCIENCTGYYQIQNGYKVCSYTCETRTVDFTLSYYFAPLCLQSCPSSQPFKKPVGNLYICVSSCSFSNSDGICIDCSIDSQFYQVSSYQLKSTNLCVSECQQYVDLDQISLGVRKCIVMCANGYYSIISGLKICVKTCQFVIHYNIDYSCQDFCQGDNPGYQIIQLWGSAMRLCLDKCPQSAFYENTQQYNLIPACVDSCTGILFKIETGYKICTASCDFVDNNNQCIDRCDYEFGGYQMITIGTTNSRKCLTKCPLYQDQGVQYLNASQCISECPSGRIFKKAFQETVRCASECNFIDYANICLDTCQGQSPGYDILNAQYTCYNKCPVEKPLSDFSQIYLLVPRCIASCPADTAQIQIDSTGTYMCSSSCIFVSNGKCYSQCKFFTPPNTCLTTCALYNKQSIYYAAYECLNTCPSAMKYLKTDADSITFCSSSCDQFALNTTCVTSCPQCYFIDNGQPTCINCTIADVVLALHGVPLALQACPINKPFQVSSGQYQTCTDNCPFVVNNICVSTCSGFAQQTSLGQYQCVAQCPIQSQNDTYSGRKICLSTCGLFMAGQICVSQCQNGQYNLVAGIKTCQTCQYYQADDSGDFLCLQSCAGLKTIQRQNGFECLATCPVFEAEGFCFDYCVAFVYGSQCVDSCPSNQYQIVNDSLVCSSCQLVDPRLSVLMTARCVDDCGGFYQDGGYCSPRCASGYYKTVNGNKLCVEQDSCVKYLKNSDTAECFGACPQAFPLSTGGKRCFAHCPISQAYVIEETATCVAECPSKSFTVSGQRIICVDICPLRYVSQTGGLMFCAPRCQADYALAIANSAECIAFDVVGTRPDCQFVNSTSGECQADCAKLSQESDVSYCVESCSPGRTVVDKKCILTCEVGFAYGDSCISDCNSIGQFSQETVLQDGSSTGACIKQCTQLVERGKCVPQCSEGYDQVGGFCKNLDCSVDVFGFCLKAGTNQLGSVKTYVYVGLAVALVVVVGLIATRHLRKCVK